MVMSVQELIFHRDTVIYLHNLGFLLNLMKSVLEPSQNMQFLGMVIDWDGNLIASGEACWTNVIMRTRSREQREYHHGPNKVKRETRVHCPGNTASTTSSSILATFANPAIKTFEMLSHQSTFRQGCKRRNFDREFKALQWKVPHFASSRLVHIKRCTNQGVGAIHHGILTGGPWSQEEGLTSTY